MDDHDNCQLILPTDKRNPCFTLYRTEDELFIHVYYGVELFEIVLNDPDHIGFKMMVGRLFNANVRTSALEDVFELDRKTIRSWGHAIRSHDPNHLQRVMLGRGANQKRTPIIDRYVVRRRRELLSEGCPNYRATLIREVESIFEVKLSGETIRQIVNECGECSSGDAPEPASMETQSDFFENRETTCSTPAETTTTDFAENRVESSLQDVSEEFATLCDELDPSKCIPTAWLPEPGDTILCNHVGVLIFASALSSIPQATTSPEPLLAQWLGSVLLGAMNIEQTKYLNWNDLGHLLNQPVRFPTPQREQLTRLATPATIDAVLRWNLEQLGLASDDNDLYYDPHTTHYTGAQNVLKGWCAAIRWADRLINSDFIHTAQGHPIYFECTDNFDDLRARFLPLISRLRASLQWSLERVLTFVVDRGIFSNQVFTQVLAEPAIHLITWEKDYHTAEDGDWERLVAEHRLSQTFGSHTQNRQRNNARDHRPYHFAYISRAWSKNEALRQIVVRATNPGGRTVQLAILTDDIERASEPIVRLMFNRWVQENDFKYLNKHFGINQLTSYRSTPYEQLRDQLTDRQVPNHAYLEKVKIGRQLNQRHARQLLIADQARRAEIQRQQEFKNLQAMIAQRESAPQGTEIKPTANGDKNKVLARYYNASKRYEKYRQERERKIEGIHEQILKNEEEKSALEKEVSRIDQLISQEMVRMDLSNKTLMDTIKISARNLFYRLFTPFKTAYDNYRDDHDYYRELTQSDGVLRWTGSEIEVHIVPQVNYPPKLQKIIESHFKELNASGLTLPDGSRRPLRLRLTRKEQISVQIKESPEK